MKDGSVLSTTESGRMIQSSFLTDKAPSSDTLRAEVKAVRIKVLKVMILREAVFMGSKGLVVRALRMVWRSQEGNRCLVGGALLETPFSNLRMWG